MDHEKHWYEVTGYRLTVEPYEVHDEDLAEALDRFLPTEHKSTKGLVKRLEKTIERFPDEPKLKNYLLVHQENLNLPAEALKTAKRTVKQHPDYFFGRMALAELYMRVNDLEKARQYFDPKSSFEIYFPDRTTYHFVEYLNYQYLVAKFYLLEDGGLEEATSRLNLMRQVMPDHPIVHKLKVIIGMKRLSEMQASKKRIEVLPQKRFEEKEIGPVLHHQVIKELYNYGAQALPPKIKQEILDLPPETATADLRAVAADSAHRFRFFYDKYKEWDEDKLSFPIHAFQLLGAFQDSKALELCLDLFREGTEYIEYWYSFDIQDYLVEPIYQFSNGQFDLMATFWQEENIDAWGKICLQDALLLYLDNDFSLYDKIELIFEEHGRYCLENTHNKKFVDSLWLDSVLVAMRNLGSERLLDLVREMYQADLFSDGMMGPLPDIEKEYLIYIDLVKDYRQDSEAQKEFTLSEYQEENKPPFEFPNEDALKDFPSYNTLFKQSDVTQKGESGSTRSIYTNNTIPVRTTPKVGRNEPCPCGSGKKYKKCCWKK